MWAPSFDLFSQICSKVSNKLYFEQLMNKQLQFFDIQPYKIDKLYAESAKKLFKQVCLKYQTTKDTTSNPNVWNENQRKIFIWFIVCYFYEIGVQDPFQANVDWKMFSDIFFSKSPSFLKFQFLNIIKLKKRIVWSNEQDSLLSKATDEEGIGKWNQISKSLFFNSNGEVFKTPKHCRQRWLNHLDGKKNKGRWTDEEDYKIFTYAKQKGKKWSKIVQVLDSTRTQHMVKNRFNSLLTKNRKNKKQKQIENISRIIKGLQRTLNLCSENEGKTQNFTSLIQEQLQKNEQSGEYIEELNEKIKRSNCMKDLKMIKKSSFQFSSFETMPLSGSWNYTGLLQNNFPNSEGSNNPSGSGLMLFYTIQSFSEFNKSKVGKTLQQNEEKRCLWSENQIFPQKCEYKIKPVYIIQKSF